MSDVIDFNKNRREGDKNIEMRDALHTIFTQVVEAQNTLNVRIEDLSRDMSKLAMQIEEVIGNLYAKYPELEPVLDLDEEELDS